MDIRRVLQHNTGQSALDEKQLHPHNKKQIRTGYQNAAIRNNKNLSEAGLFQNKIQQSNKHSLVGEVFGIKKDKKIKLPAYQQ